MEYKITTEQILEGAKKCPTAKGVLKAMFPDAFRGEWEEIELNELKLYWVGVHLVLNDDVHGGYPFEAIPFIHSCTKDLFKIEGGKIWRRK